METIYDIETFMEKVSKEATKNLSIELKTNHPEIPWKEISGMRNKLIHEYFGVNLDLVWETIKNDISKLKRQILKILDEINK